MLADLGFDLSSHFRIFFEKIFDLFFALSQTNLAVGIPGTAFINDVKLCTQIYDAISNSACLKGGAILFLTIFTRVRLPIISLPFFRVSIRRTSMRTVE